MGKVKEHRHNLFQKIRALDAEAKERAKQRYNEDTESELGRQRDLENHMKDLQGKEKELLDELQSMNQLELLAKEDFRSQLKDDELENIFSKSMTLTLPDKYKK